MACSHRIRTAGEPVRIDALVADLPASSWHLASAGAGSKGPRLYSWAQIELPRQDPGCTSMLVRRNDTTGELAYYRCYTAARVPMSESG